MDDAFEQARLKIGPGLIHSFFNSPGSYSQNNEYYVLSPLRADNSVGSFSINENTGQYFDHATGDSGDFIDLVSKSRGITLLDAAKEIIRESGGIFIEPETHKKQGRKKTTAPPPKIPIQDTGENISKLKERVQQRWCLDHWGEPETVTRYFNKEGEWVFCVCRFVKEPKVKGKKRQKNDIPFYMAEDGRWWSKWHEDLQPYPPYGIEKIKDNNLPIVVVEGEKCGRCEVSGYNVIGFTGGTNKVDKTDWKQLKGRDVYIWPDADSEMDRNKEMFLAPESQPGMKAAQYIKSQLPTAKILEVYKHKPLESDPHGWDIADFIEEGGDPVSFISDYTPRYSISVEIDPYQVYRKFIEKYYDMDNLEQVNGGFWEYSNDRHYWSRALKNDIYCNLQRWIEQTGLQWIIPKKKKATSFINEVKQYIDRHSSGFITENPFKDSAVSPFIHLKNGALKITKKEIEWFPRDKFGEDFFKQKFPINCLDFSYDNKRSNKIDPEKDCPAFYFFVKEMIPRDYIDKADPGERQAIIEETLLFLSQIIAYSLSPVKPNEYFFGIYGNQRTGKSFLLKIIKSIVGPEFCVERKIADMDNRFASSVLWGKKVFIEPDLKTRATLPEDFIKAYAGEQEITVEEKNMPAIDGVKTSLSLFFISNYEFHAKGVEGLARRLVMIPYKNNIKNHDADLLDKILGILPHGIESGESSGETFDERPAILSMAMQAWLKFCEDSYMIKSPKWATDEKDLWVLESNTAAKFLEETYWTSEDSRVTVTRSNLYDKYKDWCSEEGRKPLGKKNFYEEVRRDVRSEEVKSGGYEAFILDSTKSEEPKDQIPF